MHRRNLERIGRRAAVILVALFACAIPAAAQDTVLGLLSLPEVFGGGPCRPFEPGSISLYATPGARSPIAAIRVDQYWSFAPHGGCEGLEVRRDGGQTWLNVEVMSHSVCNAADGGPPDVVGSGWLPAYTQSGEPTVWFSSRGC